MSTVYNTTSTYDRESELGLTWYAERVAQLHQGKSLLELGIGYGMTTSIFSRMVENHVVVEGDLSIIELFKTNYPDCSAKIVHSFFEDFDTEETFDTVVMGFVLEHVDTPKLLLERYARFLKPHGTLWIAVPNARSLHRLIGHEAGFLSDLYALNDFDHQAGHKHYFDYSSLVALVRECGYEVINSEGIYLKPLTSSQLETLDLSPKVYKALLKVALELPEISNSMLLRCQYTKNGTEQNAR